MSHIAPQPSGKSAAPVQQGNHVSVERRGDEWSVYVVEDGRVYENSFTLEAHADAFAFGQRVRLGLRP